MVSYHQNRVPKLLKQSTIISFCLVSWNGGGAVGIQRVTVHLVFCPSSVALAKHLRY